MFKDFAEIYNIGLYFTGQDRAVYKLSFYIVIAPISHAKKHSLFSPKKTVSFNWVFTFKT